MFNIHQHKRQVSVRKDLLRKQRLAQKSHDPNLTNELTKRATQRLDSWRQDHLTPDLRKSNDYAALVDGTFPIVDQRTVIYRKLQLPSIMYNLYRKFRCSPQQSLGPILEPSEFDFDQSLRRDERPKELGSPRFKVQSE